MNFNQVFDMERGIKTGEGGGGVKKGKLSVPIREEGKEVRRSIGGGGGVERKEGIKSVNV